MMKQFPINPIISIKSIIHRQIRVCGIVALLVLAALSARAQYAQWKVRPVFRQVEHYAGNIWKTQGEDGRWTLQNIILGETLPESFDSIAPAKDNVGIAFRLSGEDCFVAAVITIRDDRLTAPVMHVAGTWRTMPGAALFSDGMLPVLDRNGKTGYMSASGTLAVKPKRFIQANPFSDGIAYVAEKPGKGYYIDKRGKKVKNAPGRDEGAIIAAVQSTSSVLPPPSAPYTLYGEGVVMGYKLDGNPFIPAQFHQVKPFVGSLAPVCVEGKWGFIEVKGGEIQVKTSSTRKATSVNLTLPIGLNPDLLEVCLKNPDETLTPLRADKKTEEAASFTIPATANKATVAVLYDGIIQEVRNLTTSSTSSTTSTPQTKGQLVVTKVYKASKKADKHDNEYIAAVIKNTSSATLSAKVFFYIDGTTYTKTVSVAPRKTETITTAVKVMKERYAKVSVKLSTGAASAVQNITLKPFY